AAKDAEQPAAGEFGLTSLAAAIRWIAGAVGRGPPARPPLQGCRSMFALVYASRESQPFDHAQLVELSRRADQKNKRLRITGYLNYRRGAFFQYLEGAEAHVLELMEIIAADARHQVMHMLPLGEHAERRFSAGKR
ncbi:MAG TPA: BLUF domain-containing protein, partial [Lacipirellulaceae bacterium]|nr:BLUF domain-containing protein [Lacipirellulaceae bacterium]